MEKIMIDPETFGYHFMSLTGVVTAESNNDMEQTAKQALSAYLSGYYLAQKFNNLEQHFFVSEDNYHPSLYQKILSELNKY